MRILIVDMPVLLRDIVMARLATEPDLNVSVCDSLADLPADIGPGSVDVILITAPDADPLHLEPLIGHGALRAIAVDPHGDGVAYQLRSLPKVSPDSLLSAIRATAQTN